MKLTVVLLIATMMQVSASSFAQKITLNRKAASIQSIFNEIGKQSGYDFLYDANILKKAKPVTINVKEAEFEDVLRKCLEGQVLTFSIDNKTVIVKEKTPSFLDRMVSAFASIDVRGIVLDETGNPLVGATIKVKDTNKSTKTNEKGEFYLQEVDEKAVLVISYVGYETKEITADKDVGTIKLMLVTGKLDEVNVTLNTGYQSIPKERATGSFTQIDQKTLGQQSGTNILDRLNGVASGITFDTKPSQTAQRKLNFNIRGMSSINGPLDPLIVIDNFPYEGDVKNINPNDVESITILKDAAAASIWGARAGNGVVVITTKKGRFNQPTAIDFNMNMIVSGKPDLFSLPEMSSSDFIDVEQMLFNNDVYNDIIEYQPYTALSPAVEVFFKRRDKLISEAESTAAINQLKKIDIRTDYMNYFYRQPLTWQYALRLTGGTEKNAYALSGAYDKVINQTNASLHKINLSISNVYRPVKNLLLNFSAYYTNSHSKSGKPLYNSIKQGVKNIPYLDFADEKGTSLAIATDYSSRFTATAGNGKLLDWSYYPLEDYKHSTSLNVLNDLVANFGAQQKFSNWLYAEVKYQHQRQQVENTNLQDANSYASRNMVNTFSQIDPESGVVKYIVPKGGILNTTSSILQTNNLRAQLSFNPVWTNHSLSGIIGAELRSAEAKGAYQTSYGYQSNPILLANTDFVNAYPSFVTGGEQNIPGGNSLTNTLNRFVSVFSNLAWSYKDKYVLSLSARQDASNIFGVNTNDKWKPLWSAGVAWNILKEPFYKSRLLPMLKLRATYGFQGNVDLTKAANTIISYSANNMYTNFPQAMVKQLNNPELRWEKIGQLNLGIDFSMLNNILSGSVEFYHKKGTDLYGPIAYDYTTWGLSNVITKNVANMAGKGMDISIQSKNIEREMKWTTQLLINYNRSITTKYYGPQGYSAGIIGSGMDITPLAGMPLYSIASYKWGRLDASGNPQGYLDGKLSTDYDAIISDVNKNGSNSKSIVYHGSSIPTSSYSLINTFEWKGFSLSFNISCKLGFYFRKPSISYDQLYNYGTGHADFSKRWMKPQDELITDVPSMAYPNDYNRDVVYLFSETNVEKGDHIRLQYVNLGYNFSNAFLSHLSVKNLKVYAYAGNPGLLWRANNSGLDPEYPGTLAPLKTYTIGLSIKL